MSTMLDSHADSSAIAALRATLGHDGVMDDRSELAIWCEDIATTGEPCVAVAFPKTVEQVQAVVRTAIDHDLKIVPRGAGLSYTSGYLPTNRRSVMIDMSRMAKVLEFNAEDMYLTVEAGCTWATIRATLEGSGLNPPYWGPLSGLKATAGGAASQNSIFFGANVHGTAAESILSLEVVLADGSVVHTGSAANRDGLPFFRHYGPNLAGIFIGDTGAMGIKTKVTLQLVRTAPVKRFLSYAFADAKAHFRALTEIGRSGLAIESYSFDPLLQKQRLKRESLMKDIRSLASVVKASGSLLGGLKEGARLVIAGRSFVEEDCWSLHVVVEAHCEESADRKNSEIDAIMTRWGGTSIENTLPKVIHASPFNPPNSMIGPAGERWIPVHGLVPHSRVESVFDEIEGLFAANASDIERHQVKFGYLTVAVGPGTLNIEPVFFWPDALMPVHRRHVEPGILSRITNYPAAPEAEAFVMGLRAEIKHIFRRAGGTHFQIGKSYPLKDGMEESSWAMLRAVKDALDPQGRMNPGSLGL